MDFRMPVLWPRAGVVLAGASFLFALPAQGPTAWTALTASGPSARSGHALGYDAARETIVLFGGVDATGLRGDTWEWDGAVWHERALLSGPSPRAGHRLAYDGARHRTLLFGGDTAGGPAADTWEWNGAAWQQLAPASSPGARSGHAMTYDPARQRVVLFGGLTGQGLAADTWEWNGSDWAAIATAWAPPARRGAAVTYDLLRQRVVLFGGSTALGVAADTWEWNGIFWSAAFTFAYPPPRTDAGLAFDGARQRVVLFGGQGSAAPLADTWQFDGGNWSLDAPASSPPARHGHAMAYDAARLRSVLLGGADALGPVVGETWSRGPNPLSPAAAVFGTGCGAPPLAMVPDAASPPALGRVARTLLTDTPSAVGAMAFGVDNVAFGPFALPVTLAGLGMPGCDLWTSTDALGGAVTSTSPTTAEYALAVPVDLTLVGLHLYLQAYFLAPGANALGVVVSNGVDWRFGDPGSPITLTETFVDSSHQDVDVSSSLWNLGARAGTIGGDGRHGSFDVTRGVPLGNGIYRWNTDDFVIPGSQALSGADEVVTDGRFYFTDFVLPAGTTLQFVGSQPARIWVRGRVEVDGTIDAGAPEMPFWVPTTGPAAGQHVQNFNGVGPSFTYSVPAPNFAAGQPGGLGGPGGGRGGDGADECRINGDVVQTINGEQVHIYYGRRGQDVRLSAGHAYAANAIGTGGIGAILHPLSGVQSPSPPLLLAVQYRAWFTPGGGGGGFAGPGSVASFSTVTGTTAANYAAIQPGGNPFGLLPLPSPLPGGVASLEHFLVGGAGGGGGGSHAWGTQNSVAIGTYLAGSGGTGGGGALAIRAGGAVLVSGSARLSSRGGAGVLITGDTPTTPNPDAFWGVTSPGGGGSGGSILLQSGSTVDVGGSIDVRGGQGSRTGNISILVTGAPAAFNVVSQAGSGAPGFYRLESAAGPPVFSGTGQPAYDPAQNGALLQDRDAVTGSASRWYASGQAAPTWLRYELDVDTDGDGMVDVTYTDSGVLGTLLANGAGGPVTIRFQGAVLDAVGLPVPGSLGPWRDGIGLGAGAGIELDGANGYRFELLFHSSTFPQAVVRALRVFARS